jgi:NADH:ubiquinone oxidoreductase subunit E
VGACALAPVLLVDGQVYAEVKPNKVARILSEYGFDPKTAKVAAKA